MKQHPRIIALHGAGMSGGVFAGLVPHLLGYELIADDFPGHRDQSPLLPTIAAMAGFVRARIAGRECVLLGHSMGALVAMEAARDPAVRSVILLGVGETMPVNASLLEAAKSDPLKARELVAKWSVFKESPQNSALLTVISALMREIAPEALYNDLKACENYQGPVAFAKPLLVIAGAGDKMTPPEKGRELAQKGEGTFVSIPGCGHMAMLEKPVETGAEIRSFIKNLPD